MKSFAARVRDALAREEAPKPCCRRAEWTGLALSLGAVSYLGGGGIRLSLRSDHPGTVRRMMRMLRDDFAVQPDLRIADVNRLGGRRTYRVLLEGDDARQVLEKLELTARKRAIPVHCRGRRCCRGAFLRGMFLGAGTMSDPEKGYLLEFVLHEEPIARSLASFLAGEGILAGVVERKGAWVVYVKEGEGILQVLSAIGAHGAILDMENTRILRDARNRANRAANCDAANITKMLEASDRQMEAIARIEGTIGLSALPNVLREIAVERKRRPDASVEDLGQALDPPVGKSGVYHRLRRIEAIAQTLQKER